MNEKTWWTLFWFTSNQQQPVGCLEKPALLCGTVANLIETGLTNSFKCILWLHLCSFLFLSAFWSFGKACLKEKVPWIPNFQLIIIEFVVDMGFWVWVNREILLRALIISFILSYWAFRLYLFHANSMWLLGTYKEDLLLVLRKKSHICYIIPLQANSWVMS